MRTRAGLLVTAMMAGASLAGCQKAAPQVAALPLDMGVAQPLGEAPAPGALPPAPPAQIAAPASYGDAYAYPDRAWGMSWAFGDSPPDYAFVDDGVTPWVWVADDDSERLAEPVPGGERYYYFEPGAYTPFYVQDPTYGYAFANGALVSIYDRSGRQSVPSANPRGAATAGQYLARGRTLRQEAANQPHRPVAAANWSARRGLVAAQSAALERQAKASPAWRAYHDQHAAQVEAHFAGEAARREAWAAQTDVRLSEPLRAERERRVAQSISQGGMGTGRARPPASTALSQYASAPPTHAGRPARAAQVVRRAGTQLHRAFAQTRQARPRASARPAERQAHEAAYRGRGSAAAPDRQPAAAHVAPTSPTARPAERNAPADGPGGNGKEKAGDASLLGARRPLP